MRPKRRPSHHWQREPRRAATATSTRASPTESANAVPAIRDGTPRRRDTPGTVIRDAGSAQPSRFASGWRADLAHRSAVSETPSLSSSESQASPEPSRSVSRWSWLGSPGQVSRASRAPSRSKSSYTRRTTRPLPASVTYSRAPGARATAAGEDSAAAPDPE